MPGQHTPPHHHRPRRAAHLPTGVRALGNPGQCAHRQRCGVHRHPPPRRTRRPRSRTRQARRPVRPLPAPPPQTCGKVERFQQTQKKWLAAQPPTATVAGLHRQLSRFRRYYNDIRPHRALGRTTPWQAYTARPKATASGPYIDPHCRVRHDRVDQAGTVTLRHNSRLHHIGLGRPLAGTPITLLVDDLHIRAIHRHTGELIRELTLDPARDFQPRRLPPGPPKKRP